MLPGMQANLIPTKVSRAISLIVLHCSATPSGRPLAADRTAPAVINEWHAARGFKRDAPARAAFNPQLPSIGYHYVIDLDGHVWTGRALDEIGAHVAGYNAASVGICLVGGAEPEARYTPAQWQALAELARALSEQLDVPLHRRQTWRAGKGVCGHRDLSPDANGNGRVEPAEWLKTCPGFDVSAWLSRGLVPLAANVLPGTGA